MKIARNGIDDMGQNVAPRVGAWIEKRTSSLLIPDLAVAPRVGAWIEKVIWKELQIGDVMSLLA